MHITSVHQFVPVLQTAVGPMILISGIGLILITLSNRLGRIVVYLFEAPRDGWTVWRSSSSRWGRLSGRSSTCLDATQMVSARGRKCPSVGNAAGRETARTGVVAAGSLW